MAKEKELEEHAKALAQGAGEALAGLNTELLGQQDYDDEQREKSPIDFIGLRQKDLKSEDGKSTIQTAGGFRTGGVADEIRDRSDLEVTILGFRSGRVYFQDLTDRQPTCKSDDMVNGSHEPMRMSDHDVFGRCPECYLSQWGSAENGRMACRENRRILVFDWANERPAIITIGPSSLKPWVQYADYVDRQARPYAKDGRTPFIHHLLRTKVTSEYRSDPAPHYVVKWESMGALPKTFQEFMANIRTEAMTQFRDAVRVQAYEAEDYVGRQQPQS